MVSNYLCEIHGPEDVDAHNAEVAYWIDLTARQLVMMATIPPSYDNEGKCKWCNADLLVPQSVHICGSSWSEIP